MRFKKDFFNLCKIMPWRCRPRNQDEDAPAFASIRRQARCRWRRTGLFRL